jgi:hypothetical protein
MSQNFSDQEALFNYFYNINPMLPKAIFAMLKPCENCTCKLDIGDSQPAFYEHFDQKSQTCEKTYNKSIASLLNNPNVVAHIKFDESEAEKLHLIANKLERKAHSHKVITDFAL